MTTLITMQAPAGIGGTITGSPSGTKYQVNSSGQIQAQLADVGALQQIGFVQLPVASSVGTPTANVTAVELGDAFRHVTQLTIGAGAVLPAIAGGASLGVGLLLYTFPVGDIFVEASLMNVGITQSQGNINADTPTVGLGTTIASGVIAVLSGTAAFQNIQVGKAAANCTGTKTNQVVKATASPFELLIAATGGLAHSIFFNAAFAWAASGDAAAVLSGNVTVFWKKLS